MSEDKVIWEDEDVSELIDQSVFDEEEKPTPNGDTILAVSLDGKTADREDETVVYRSEAVNGDTAVAVKTEKDDADKTKKLDLKAGLSKIKQSAAAKKAAGTDGEKREDKQMSKTSEKKGNSIIKAITYVLVVVCSACLLAAVAWILSTDVLGFTDENEEVVVTIPKEYDMGDVADILHEEGIVKFKGLFKVFAAISHATEKISGGTYVLNKNYDYRAIIAGMTKSGGKMVEVQVTIPEGYNMTQIFNLLEEKSVCFAADLWEAAQYNDFDYDFLDKETVGEKLRLEGYLFPDTYKFYMNDTPTRVISKFLNNFENRITDAHLERAEEMGYSLHEILTVASIIEKEAAGSVDRKDISSVIYNRLKNTSGPTVGFLQLDSTIHYILFGTDTPFSTEIDSPYNTYKYKGLPAGPIANPGLAAIEAALYPSSTGYYYFAINKKQETQFFKTYNSFINFCNSSEYGGFGR